MSNILPDNQDIKENIRISKVKYMISYVISILVVLFIVVFIHVGITPTKQDSKDTQVISAEIPLLVTYIGRYMEEQLLKYLSDVWLSEDNLRLELKTIDRDKHLLINNKPYRIASIDNVQGIFGVLKLTIRDKEKPTLLYKIQINKRLDTSDIIDVIFDKQLDICDNTKEFLCSKTMYRAIKK